MENARKYAEEAAKSSKMRFRGFLKALKGLDNKREYLEVGAGSGILAAMIAEHNKEVNITAIELSSNMITVAKEHLKNKKYEPQVKFIKGNIEDEKLLKKIGKYDFIYSTFSMHHWNNAKKVINDLMKLLNNNGVLMIYDLKRVWWLYLIPNNNGFFQSIRASYKNREIKNLLKNIEIEKYRIENIFPFFIQNITIWK
ncbi:MAG: class I SAM-dependent methyltransferase [Desulfobacula sp.]|nr:class I SAM-dependent methyltransferase [Desulfobacula sp.]